MSENSIEFSLSNSEQRDSWLNSSHRTLDTDKYIILEYNSIITPFLHTLSVHPWQNLQTDTGSYHALVLMSHQSAAPSSGSNSIPLTDRTIGRFTSGLPRRSRRLQSGTPHTPVITNGHLLICDWCFRILKGSKMWSLDSDKDVVKSEV